jgi:RHH-type transcriptional regulator, rel operon repressor / antitoxin RelB
MNGRPRETISFRIDGCDRLALDAIASHISRKRSELINDAIRAYLDVQRWQIAEIEKAIHEADAGDFASAAEVRAVFKKLAK